MKPLVNMTINELLDETTGRYPGRPALRYKGRTWTYRELNDYTDCLAAGLLADGIRRGEHVSILSENTPNAVLAFLAVEKAGAVACMPGTSLLARELADLFSVSDVRHLMIGSRYKNNVFFQQSQELLKKVELDKLYDIGMKAESPYTTLDDLAALGRQNPELYKQLKQAVKPGDNGLILYTSGTTGHTSKAVVSSYFHLVNGGIQKAHSQNITHKDIVCCALHLFHIFCLDVNVLSALAAGACLAMPDDLHTESILKTIEEESCTVLSCVPCMYLAMMSRSSFGRYNLSTLRTGIIGGAYCPPETFARIEQAFGFTLLPGLGQTEATAGIAIASPGDSLAVRSTTLGHFVDHSQGRIIDLETGRTLPTGQTGEICVKSRLLMTGYYKRPDLTSQAIDAEGWLHTGDIGWLDEAGLLHYKGRIKEIINRGGEKILPSEVEGVFLQMECVKECKVFGVEDSYYGEEVCACLVLREPGFAGEEDIRSYAVSRLAKFKQPRYVLFLDSLPLNASGKVSRQELISLAKTRLMQQKPDHPA